MISDYETLKKKVQNSLPSYKTVDLGVKTIDVYNEPRWMQLMRIECSLEAMNEAIIDESIPNYGPGRNNSAFFISTNKEARLDRSVFIEDLGFFKYKPAFDNLREVWLHDHDKWLTSDALNALAKINDERLLVDLEKKIKDIYCFEDSYFDEYLHAVTKFKSNKAIKILMDLADVARHLYNAEVLDEARFDSKKFREEYFLGATSDILELITFQLIFGMRTNAARNAAKEILSWFPYNRFLQHYFNRSQEFKISSFINQIKNPKLTLPENYKDKIVGSEEPLFF